MPEQEKEQTTTPEDSTERSSPHEHAAQTEQPHHNQGQQEPRLPEEDERRTVVIYSDPGRTSHLVRQLLDEQNRDWARHSRIKHEQVLIPLRTNGTLDLDTAQHWAREAESDITIIVTEIPRTAGRRSKSVELHFAEKLAVVSLPALGPVAVKHSLRREMDRAVRALIYDSVAEAKAHGGFTSRVEDQDGHETVYITPRAYFPGRIWMLLGMVAANEPLWSLRKLSAMFAAAAATGAFGVFFPTIWEMAEALPAWRLGLTSLAAVTVIVGWLILSNGLWDTNEAAGGKLEAVLYNTSTVLSLLLSVAVLYGLLFLAILTMGLFVIEPGFMGETLGGEVTLVEYAHIAWLAASMGTVAGAFGSNFDDDADLRNLTQGSRELQRYPKDEQQR
ncbi:hypothetical protein [Nesterenkonia alba]|uniref:hypothetical protein n=1 Tax=Nesterenkonia alba TaxID=515814 RepID=UPI0003B6D4AC|nr:hypothetical protein [Nesterenkonia alba]